MDMLLRHTTAQQLTQILRKHSDKSSLDFCRDPKRIHRARRLAKENGIWEKLNSLDPTVDIPVIKRSDYRAFERTGNRTPAERALHKRLFALLDASLALWLDHPKADLDYLQDLIWAICDSWTWVLAAHEKGGPNDLASTEMAAKLAGLTHVLGDRLEDEVVERVHYEIRTRVLEKCWSPDAQEFWHTCEMNWNHVCNGAIVRTALLLVNDPATLATMIHGPIQRMTYALDGFAADGGCLEGPGYWGYGFGNFVHAALDVYNKTGGEINLMADEQVEKICRYPLACQIDGRFRSAFGDAHHGLCRASTALMINQFYKIPELYGLCHLNNNGKLRLDDMLGLALATGRERVASLAKKDHVLPSLGQATIRGKATKSQTTILAKGGRNDVPHNHNDIGSFFLHRNGKLWLTDPGSPLYSRRTFSEHRYEDPICSAVGHSVPVIDGVMQQEGGQYTSELTVENLNGKGNKSIRIDMSNAYPEGKMQSLVRTFTMASDSNDVVMEDAYVFSRKPKALTEVFVTFEKVTVAKGGASVQIGPKRSGMALSCEAGTFTVEEQPIVKKMGAQEILNRILFTPNKLAKKLTLRFEIA